MIGQLPRSTLFPYTTLFRSQNIVGDIEHIGSRVDGEGFHCHTAVTGGTARSEEHTSELQSPDHLVCGLLQGKEDDVAVRRINADASCGFVAGRRKDLSVDQN